MGNRGSSGVGGKRNELSSHGKQHAKFLRKQIQAKHKPGNHSTSVLAAATDHHHHPQQQHSRHQNSSNTDRGYHYHQQATRPISSSNDLLLTSGSHQNLQIWPRPGGAPSSSSPSYPRGRQARPPHRRNNHQRNQHNHNHHRLHYQQDKTATIYFDNNDDYDDDDELAYQQQVDYEQQLPPISASGQLAAYTQSGGAGSGGAGSSQTYRSTPLASSSSSSHSTAAVQHDPYEDDCAPPYHAGGGPHEDEDDSLYLAGDFGHGQADARYNHLNHHHHNHLSHITVPPARCLDACCNPPPVSSNQRTQTSRARLYSQASGASRQQPARGQQAKSQQRTGGNLQSRIRLASRTQANMNSNGIKQMEQLAATTTAACCPLGKASLERGLALAEPERKRLGLLGLLPAAVQDQEQQSRAVMNFLDNCKDELGKYVYLRNLKDFNEKLFYYTLTRNVEKLMPLVYTPTVGLACQKFSEIYMRPRGLWVTALDAGRVKQVVENWPERDVRVIVVTDGERILGLGDLGANGMGISVGKLSLYTALAGIAPANVLPVTIDVGTNNETFLRDPFYIGLRQARLRGAPYESLIEEFMREAADRWGRSCLIQFEDFANSTAFNLLKRYRRDYCTFNDDIQGTASVALAGLITAVRQTGKRLSDCNFLFYGAGEANLGTAHLAIMAMLDEGSTRAEAKKRIWLVDSKGLVVSSRSDLNEHKAELAQEMSTAPPTKLEEIIDLVKPLAIIGASAQGGAFTQAICQKMAQYSAKPIIFALSNPTSKAECTAAQAYEWTRGTCVFASGSPFDPVEYEGKTFVTGQGNNAYIFPGVGLAAIGAHTHIIPEETFLVAARALSDQVTSEDLEVGLVYPSLTKIREVTLRVATRVLEYFYAERLATYRPEPTDKRAFLEAIQYDPRY